jgi:hypothetical protein
MLEHDSHVRNQAKVAAIRTLEAATVETRGPFALTSLGVSLKVTPPFV